MAAGGGDEKGERARAKQRGARNDNLAFAKIFNEVITKSSLSPRALKLLAYRMTKVGNFVLHHADVKKQIGMSKDMFYACRDELVAAGLLERQPAVGQRRSKEKLLVGVPGPNESGYIWVWMKHIRLLQPAGLAVYMLLLAHAPRQALYASEVRERFGWSDKTTQKWLTYLIHHGLAGEALRRKKGCFDGSVYAPADVSRDEIATWSLRPGTPRRTKPEATFPDAISAHVNPPETKKADGNSAASYKGSTFFTEDLNPSTSPHYSRASRAGRAEREEGSGEAGADIGSDGGVAHWLKELAELEPETYERWTADVADEASLATVRDVLDDAQLRDDLYQAAQGRIGRHLLAPGGLEGYRWLVANCSIVADAYLEHAHSYVIELIAKRIGGVPGKWLNSWRWLGKVVADRVQEAGDIPSDDPGLDNDREEIPF